MTHVHQTWYRLVDGTQADPNEVERGADGVLRNKAGVAVAMRDSGVPLTSGTRDTPDRRVAKAPKDRELKAGADDAVGYRTRGRPGSTQGAKS